MSSTKERVSAIIRERLGKSFKEIVSEDKDVAFIDLLWWSFLNNGISEEVVDDIASIDFIAGSSTMSAHHVRSSIVLYLNTLFVGKEEITPIDVRVALLSPVDPHTWLIAMDEIVIPYLYRKKDYYFG